MGNYFSDLKEQRKYYENGNIKSLDVFRHGKLERYEYWDVHGKLKIQTWNIGALTRKKEWTSEGHCWRETYYENGFILEQKDWYQNGQVCTHRCLRNGRLDGTYRYWSINGRLQTKLFFRNGLKEGEGKRWELDGNPGLLGNSFYREDSEIDENFTIRKKMTLLSLKQKLSSKYRHPGIDKFIIDDLVLIIY